MTHWMTLDDWDSDGINKSVRCNCPVGRDHHQADCTCVAPGSSYESFGGLEADCPVHGLPQPLKPWQPLSEEAKRKVDEWISQYMKTLMVAEPKPPPVGNVWLEMEDLTRRLKDMPPRRTEPIKLTPGQWAILPHGDPRIPPYARPFGDLMGIPVVMADDESESTPVVEGWLKPKRKQRWWTQLWCKVWRWS